EDCKIRIPGDSEIFADLRGVKRRSSLLGGVRFVAESTKDGHSDRFWALALANRAAHGAGGAIELIQKNQKRIMW
ncbi:MAG: hypothetical protein HP060_02335, partial [Opitutales bacterium]|nr:hypothetical protein [Opitutales bacterium]